MNDTDMDFSAELPGASRNYKQETRTMAPVQKIVIKGSVDLYFRRSSTPHLVVAGQTPEALQRVKTTFKGDKLVIEMEGGIHISSGHGSISIGSMSGGIVCVNGQRIDASNVVTGRVVVGVGLPEIPSLKIKGSGDACLMDLRQAGLEIEIDGAGDVTADGQVEQLAVTITGAGDVDARELLAQRASLSITGAGDIVVHVSKDVDASITGAGDIVVHGNPAIRREQVFGAGRVKFKGKAEPREHERGG